MREIAESIRNALNRTETLVFGAKCIVNYSGRAETHLPLGERIIMIKGDRTLLIHQPHGNNPINYMKENSVHEVKEKNNKLFIYSSNKVLKEFIDIEVSDIYFISSAKLKDNHKIQLVGNEKDMSDMIYNDPSIIEEGLRPVSREEQTKNGFIDVLCHDKDNNLIVVECKRFKSDFSAVEQLRRYVEKIKKNKGIDNVKGVLASPSITNNALDLLKEYGFSHVIVEPPKHYRRFKKNQKLLDDF